MPYIRKNERAELDGPIDALATKIASDGQLNYAVTRLALARVKASGLCYVTLSEVYGTLQLAAQELYRRVVAPYEDRKIQDAGDLPEFAETKQPEVRALEGNC